MVTGTRWYEPASSRTFGAMVMVFVHTGSARSPIRALPSSSGTTPTERSFTVSGCGPLSETVRTVCTSPSADGGSGSAGVLTAKSAAPGFVGWGTGAANAPAGAVTAATAAVTSDAASLTNVRTGGSSRRDRTAQ